MGQRHQIFIIARAGSHYRSLAVVHHQWLYGLSALRTCLNILSIFSDKANRIPLQQELNFAQDFFKNQAAPPTERPPLPRHDESSEPCRFPFVTTCVVVGAVFNRHTATRAAMAHEEPYNLGFDQGDNNDGITVIDISDLDNLRYCFVQFWDELEDNHQPMTARRYLDTYPEHEPFVLNNAAITAALDKFALIDADTLANAWPWGPWKIDAEATLKTSVASMRIADKPAVKDLFQQSLAKAIDTAFLTPDFDVDVFEATIDTMSHQRSSLIPQLLRNAERVGPSSCSEAMLRLAYKDQPSLEWTKFVNLDAPTLSAALSSDDFCDAKEVILLSSSFAQDVSRVVKALSTKEPRHLYVMERPDREDDDAAKDIFLEAAASALLLARNKCLLSALSSRAIRQTLWLPTSDPLVHNRSFPLVQMLVYRKSLEGLGPDFETVFLGDALLTPERCVTALFRYVEAVCVPDMSFNGTCLDAACAIAMAPSTLGSVDSMEMGMLPAEAYTLGFTAQRKSWAVSCKTRDLVPGQYTLLLHAKDSMDEEETALSSDTTPQVATFRYCFLYPKVEIRVDAVTPEANQRKTAQARLVRPEDVDVLDAATFLERTAPWADRSALDTHMQHLQITAAKLSEQQGSLSETVLSAMETAEACDYLGKFLNYVPEQNKTLGRQMWKITSFYKTEPWYPELPIINPMKAK